MAVVLQVSAVAEAPPLPLWVDLVQALVYEAPVLVFDSVDSGPSEDSEGSAEVSVEVSAEVSVEGSVEVFGVVFWEDLDLGSVVG